MPPMAGVDESVFIVFCLHPEYIARDHILRRLDAAMLQLRDKIDLEALFYDPKEDGGE